jgi:hypothetical protein
LGPAAAEDQVQFQAFSALATSQASRVKRKKKPSQASPRSAENERRERYAPRVGKEKRPLSMSRLRNRTTPSRIRMAPTGSVPVIASYGTVAPWIMREEWTCGHTRPDSGGCMPPAAGLLDRFPSSHPSGGRPEPRRHHQPMVPRTSSLRAPPHKPRRAIDVQTTTAGLLLPEPATTLRCPPGYSIGRRPKTNKRKKSAWFSPLSFCL